MSSTISVDSLTSTTLALGKLCIINTDFLDSVQLLFVGDFTQIPIIIFFIAVVFFNFKNAQMFKLPTEYKEYPFSYLAPFLEFLFHWIPSNILIAAYVAMHRTLYRYFFDLNAEQTKYSSLDYVKYIMSKVFFGSQPESQMQTEMSLCPFLITLAISVYSVVAVAFNRPPTTLPVRRDS